MDGSRVEAWGVEAKIKDGEVVVAWQVDLGGEYRITGTVHPDELLAATRAMQTVAASAHYVARLRAAMIAAGGITDEAADALCSVLLEPGATWVFPHHDGRAGPPPRAGG